MRKTISSTKLQLKALTIRDLSATTIAGGGLVPNPIRDTAEPSRCTVSCLPPKSEGCYTEIR